MIAAAALCPAPPLLLPGITGATAVLPELRRACQDAVAELVSGQPDLVAVVGPAARTREWEPGAPFALAEFAPGLPEPDAQPALSGQPGSVRGGRGSAAWRQRDDRLSLSLGIGRLLLDLAGCQAPRLLVGIGHDETASGCGRLGAGLAGRAGRVALLAMGDGSACRGPRAPGHLDQRSFAFDAEVERALRAGDVSALLAVDAGVAGELMATGRPAWQVLAGALDGKLVESAIRYCDDPFGVAYLVASIRVGCAGEEADSG